MCVKRNLPRNAQVIRHKAVLHEKKNPFFCSICETNFTRKYHLRRHISTVHEGQTFEFVYNCPKCSKVFHHKHILASHISYVHEGEKMFGCSI